MHNNPANLTHEHILMVADRFFLKRGFEETKIKDIAQEADVSETLVFKYFGSKQDLYIAVFQWRTKKLLQHFEALFDSNNPLDVLYQFSKDLLFPTEEVSELMKTIRDIFQTQNEHTVAHLVPVPDTEASIIEPLMKKAQALGQMISGDTQSLSRIYWKFISGSFNSTKNYPDSVQQKDIDCFFELIKKKP